MLYDEARMALTKERLEDLRKEKKMSFEQLSKQLAERGVNISHTNLKNYEINDPVHSLYEDNTLSYYNNIHQSLPHCH